jgi:DNA-binding MarR family transcriptional regulator
LKYFLFDFFLQTRPEQRAVLYYLYNTKSPTSLTAICRKLKLSHYGFIRLRILEDMGLIERKKNTRKGISIAKVFPERFKKYWPEIERWEVKKESKRGFQTKRFFLILAEEIKNQGFTPKIVEIIKNINQNDFKEKGWEINRATLGDLKRKVQKTPIKKFFDYLEKLTADS